MQHRTRLVAAAAVATAALAGSSAAATAPTAAAAPLTDTHNCVPEKSASGNDQSVADSQLAARLGVSPTRLDQALRQVKMALSHDSGAPTQEKFDATLARILSISVARVRHVFPEVTATSKGIKVTVSRSDGAKGPKTACAEPSGSKAHGQPGSDAVPAAFTAAVASELQVTTAQVNAALQPLFAAGSADPSSPAFAAAAQSLGVSVQQLTNALTQAKESLAPAG